MNQNTCLTKRCYYAILNAEVKREFGKWMNLNLEMGIFLEKTQKNRKEVRQWESYARITRSSLIHRS